MSAFAESFDNARSQVSSFLRNHIAPELTRNALARLVAAVNAYPTNEGLAKALYELLAKAFAWPDVYTECPLTVHADLEAFAGTLRRWFKYLQDLDGEQMRGYAVYGNMPPSVPAKS